MVELYQKQQIIISGFLEGKSQRRIAKEQGIDRGTVAKYIREYEEALKELSKGDFERNKLDIINNIVETPKYNSENRYKRKLTDEVIEKIEQHLKDNERKRQIGQRKQQKKKIDIYEALIAENHDIGYVTVSKAINVLSNRHREAFIKGEYFPGDICEFDWGEVKIFIDGVLRIFQLAVFTSA